MAIKDLVLYSYCYSSASWRIRSVLELKKIPHKQEPINLLKGVQRSEEYAKVNPMEQVPALRLEDDAGNKHVLTSSLAIIQFLEENFPSNSIYPKDPIMRAKSCAIADAIASGLQPIQNLGVLLDYLKPFGKDTLEADERRKVGHYWNEKKLVGIEKLVKETAGKYCVGDEVSIADVCLVPQMFNANRFGVDLSKYPTLQAINERLLELDMFQKSHPKNCPDFPQQ